MLYDVCTLYMYCNLWPLLMHLIMQLNSFFGLHHSWLFNDFTYYLLGKNSSTSHALPGIHNDKIKAILTILRNESVQYVIIILVHVTTKILILMTNLQPIGMFSRGSPSLPPPLASLLFLPNKTSFQRFLLTISYDFPYNMIIMGQHPLRKREIYVKSNAPVKCEV